jgi:hypothetical protein
MGLEVTRFMANGAERVRLTITKDDAKLNQPLADQSCASFEVWFLNPACSPMQHAKKVARTKQRLV